MIVLEVDKLVTLVVKALETGWQTAIRFFSSNCSVHPSEAVDHHHSETRSASVQSKFPLRNQRSSARMTFLHRHASSRSGICCALSCSPEATTPVQASGLRYFTSPDTIAVWQILQKLFLDGSPINEITVRDRLPRGLSLDWAFEDSDVYKADVYISILKDNYLRRSLAAAMERGGKQVGDPQLSPSVVRDDLQRTILDLALDDAGHRDTSLKAAPKSAMTQARDNAAIMSERGMISIDLCSSRVNWLTAGARRKELTILGGLTGMGKSLYMNALVDRNSRVLRKRGLVISLEMSAEAICFRLIGTAFGVSAKRLATGFMRRQESGLLGRFFFSLPQWQRG